MVIKKGYRYQGSAIAREISDAMQDIAVAQYSWKFSYGPYMGKEIVQVPSAYLEQVRAKSHNMTLVKKCAEEIERRQRIAGVELRKHALQALGDLSEDIIVNAISYKGEQ